MVLCCGGRCSGGTANDDDKEALGYNSAQLVLVSWSLWPSPGPGESIGGSVMRSAGGTVGAGNGWHVLFQIRDKGT